jgi:hypothetical protein
MPDLAIEFENHRKSFEPGEEISVMLSWDLQSPPDAIELRAVWNTEGKGSTDVGVERSVVIDSPNSSDTRRMSFTLPEAPYSFSGHLISLVWALELVVKPSEQSCRKEFTMAPGASEVILRPVEQPGRFKLGV